MEQCPMFNHRLLSVGADPEVFWVNRKNGHPKSVEGLLGGTKARPIPMVGLNRGFMVQEDNVAAEYNIPPASSAEEFDRNIFQGLRYIMKEATKHGCKVAVTDTLEFDIQELQTPHASTMGCEPDFGVWEGEWNPRPDPPMTFRTAAGHVHFGWTTPNETSGIIVGKMADLFLGVPSILVTQPSKRRELYGKAGAWRFKPYGGEYRTLGNFWIETKAFRTSVFKNAVAGFQRLMHEQDFFIDALEEYGPDIVKAINTHDLELAEGLVERFNIPVFQAKRAEHATVRVA